MANNVWIATDVVDSWKPSKEPSRERIEGIAALIMGLRLALEHPIPKGPPGES
jgi:hypothetical protein